MDYLGDRTTPVGVCIIQHIRNVYLTMCNDMQFRGLGGCLPTAAGIPESPVGHFFETQMKNSAANSDIN